MALIRGKRTSSRVGCGEELGLELMGGGLGWCHEGGVHVGGGGGGFGCRVRVGGILHCCWWGEMLAFSL